jgi:pimeloyl-ACP methyl ester carboxylesterase
MTHSILDPSISSHMVDTPRLRVHYLSKGPDDGVPVIFVHGNLSSSLLWDETLTALPGKYRGLAIDMRGFGDSETRPVDATRGMGDFADDLDSFITTLGLTQPVHLVGHSTGGGAVMHYAIDHPTHVASITLIASVSPYGFGGTKDAEGTPTNSDFAGSGAGLIFPEMLARLKDGDTTGESDFSPRNVMKGFYWKPAYQLSPEREDAFVEAIVKTAVGEQNFPGDLATSENWPGVSPGKTGVNNALSGKYVNLSGIADISPKPPILWIHGTEDLVISDGSFWDVGVLGKLGMMPDWPGDEIHPAQPMKQQIRAVLAKYEANGGQIREVEIPDSGHSPFIDQPETFQAAFFSFLAEQS